jgi:hypothetical protein
MIASARERQLSCDGGATLYNPPTDCSLFSIGTKCGAGGMAAPQRSSLALDNDFASYSIVYSAVGVIVKVPKSGGCPVFLAGGNDIPSQKGGVRRGGTECSTRPSISRRRTPPPK